MASGVYDNGSTSSSFIKPRLVWTSTPDVASNSSLVKVELWAQNTASGSGYVDGTGAWQIQIGDQWSGKLSAYVKVQAGAGWVKVVEWSRTVPHESDGTKTIKIQATGGISSSSQWSSTKTGLEIDLGTIYKTASTFTVTSPIEVDGSTALTVNINPGFTGAYHVVTWVFGNSRSHTVRGATTSASFVVPTDWLDQIPTATAGVGGVSVTTYADAACTQQVGSTASTTYILNVPASMTPTLSGGWASVSPDNSGTNVPSGIYVANYSKAKATINTSRVTASPGTYIASYRIEYAGKSYGSPYTTPTITTAGTNTVRVVARDARGRESAQSFSFTAYGYANPTLSGVSVYRSNSGGTATDNGGYAAIKATANVSSLGGANTYTLTAKIKTAGGSYGAAHALTSGQLMTLAGLSVTENYYVRIDLRDSMGNTTYIEVLIPAGSVQIEELRGFQVKDGGRGAGFGTPASAEGWMRVGYEGGIEIVRGKLRIGNTEISEAQLIQLLNLL